MSGTLSNVHRNVSFALNRHYEVMFRLQEQVYTGSRINRASDDSSVAYRLLGLNTQQRLLGNYMDNISRTISTLEISLTNIAKIGESLAKTKEILAGVTGTDGTIGQNISAQAIDSALEELVLFANWKHIGQHLYSGGDTASAPYLAQRSNGKITSVTYQGSFESRDIEVAPGVESRVYYVGDNVFRSNNRGTPELVLDNTGAAVGAGTSSVTGYTWLTVTDDGGGSYDLSIDDGATTVNVAAAADITNIAVTNSDGQVLYIDGTDIDSAGIEQVSVPGTHDIFNTLITLREVLENENNFSVAQVNTLRNNGLEGLEEVHLLLTQLNAIVGAEINFLNNTKEDLDDIKFDAEDETTRLQESDIAQLAIDLSRREVLYQMSLSVAGRVMSMSLLDFI